MGGGSRPATIPERLDAVIRFFLYVLVFWLPYSPAVIETCIVFSFVCWLVKRAILHSPVWRRERGTVGQKAIAFLKGFKPAPSPLNGPIAFFVVVCVLSVISSSFFENAGHNFLTKTLEWFIIYFLVIETMKERKHWMIILAVWVFTAFSTVLDSFVQFYFTHKDIFLGHVIEPGGKATAGFKTPNGLGGYLSLFIPFMLAALFLDWKKTWTRILSLLVLCLSLWSLAITLSRGAIVGAGLSIMFFLCVYLTRDIKRRNFFVLPLFAVLGVGLLLVLGGYIDTGFSIRNETAQWRLNVWRDAMVMIKDRPILGHGINTFMETFEAYRRDPGTNPTYAHNCYIQLAVETGMAGLLGFLWIIGRLIRQCLQEVSFRAEDNKNDPILSLGLLSGIIGFLVHSFFDTNLYSLQLSVYLWLMIGVLITLNSNIRKTQMCSKRF